MLKTRDDRNVSSLIKRLGITKDAVASSIDPMDQVADLLDEEFSQDDEESPSLLLALTRSETDNTSVSGSLAAESRTADDMKKSARDGSALNQHTGKTQSKRFSSFRSRRKRS